MEVDINIDNDKYENISPSERKIYEKNKELNKQRIGFFTFLMNSAKGEIAFDGFQKYCFGMVFLIYFYFLYVFAYFVQKQVNFGEIFSL